MSEKMIMGERPEPVTVRGLLSSVIVKVLEVTLLPLASVTTQ